MKTKSLSIFLVALFVVEMNLGTAEEIPFEEEKNNDDKNEKNKGIKYEIIKGEIPTYNFSLKTILIGNSMVGKSALCRKICENKFSKGYSATVGFEFFYLGFQVKNIPGYTQVEPVLKYQIWDLCGKELYRSLITNFYRNTSVCLLVYDVTNVKSFNDIGLWLEEVKKGSSDRIEHFVLIGNKIDLKNARVVAEEAGKNLAKEKGMKFVEVSAKTGDGIKKLEYILAEIIFEEFKKKNVIDENNEKNDEKIVENDIEVGLIGGKKHTCSSFLCDCCKKICENC